MNKIIKLDVLVNDDDIKDIMESACTGGINYWCKKINFEKSDVWKEAGEFLANDLPVILTDFEGQKYELTSENLIKAIEKCCGDIEIILDDEGKMHLDTEDFPCDVADMIVREAIGYGCTV